MQYALASCTQVVRSIQCTGLPGDSHSVLVSDGGLAEQEAGISAIGLPHLRMLTREDQEQLGMPPLPCAAAADLQHKGSMAGKCGLT